MRRLPGPADDRLGYGGDSRGSLRIVSGLAENPNSIFCDDSHGARGSKWMSGSAECGTTRREANVRSANSRSVQERALQSANRRLVLFS
jgi:hypothetical protein